MQVLMFIECMYLAIHVTKKEQQVIIFSFVRSKTFTVSDFTVFIICATRITTLFPSTILISYATTSLVCSASILLEMVVRNFISWSLNTWWDLCYIMPISSCFHSQGFSTEVTTVPTPCHCMQLHKELVDGFYSSQIPAWASILMSPKLGDTRLQHYARQIYIQTNVASHKSITFVTALQCNICKYLATWNAISGIYRTLYDNYDIFNILFRTC